MFLVKFYSTNLCEAAAHVQQYLNQEIEFQTELERTKFDPVRQEQLDQKTIDGKARVINVAAEMLIDTTTSCMTCQVYRDPATEGCPNIDTLSFINTTMLA